jgi:hypothetical protein
MLLPRLCSVEQEEEDAAPAGDFKEQVATSHPRFSSCLQRRNSIEMYGWHIVHTEEEYSILL